MKKRIVFMGTPSYATEILRALTVQNDMEVRAIFTQSDKKSGRGQNITFPHVKQFILDSNLNIPIFQPETLKDENITKAISSLKPDFIVVAAYGKLLPKSILDIAPCINLHASLLPKYRGASPIQQAILSNDIYSGITAMKMEAGLDTGEMLGFSYCRILGLNSQNLFELLGKLSAKLTIKVLRSYHDIFQIKQLNAISSKTAKITKENGLVSFYMSYEELKQKSLAFSSWPEIYLSNGLKIKSFELEAANGGENIGQIVKIDKNSKSISVNCKDAVIKILSIQAPSKKETDAYSYINGQRMKVGDTFC